MKIKLFHTSIILFSVFVTFSSVFSAELKIDEEILLEIPKLPVEDSLPKVSHSFSDIDRHPYETAIKYVKEQGIVNGYSDGTFRPNAVIDRAQMTKIVMVAVYGENITGEKCFPDVNNEWFAPHICTAKIKGIVSGTADGLFHPSNTVTFSEALKIALNTYGIQVPETEGEWFEKYVVFSKKNNLTFTPAYSYTRITRGEMAEMIHWISKFPKNITDTSGENVSKKTVAITLDSFAQCIGKSGAIFYGTEWCPHCQEQKKILGTGKDFVIHIDCDENQFTCQESGITAYPTWKFTSGEIRMGVQSLEDLSKATNCELPVVS